MNRIVRSFLLILCSLVSAASLNAQTSYTTETGNNTSACSSSGPQAGCFGNFAGLTDHYTQSDSTHGYTRPGPPSTPPASNVQTKSTVAPASNISTVPFNTLLYPGYPGAIQTKIVCHFQAWFGANNHINIGMDMNQSVNQQIQNAIDRGCDYVSFDWYGQNHFEDPVTKAWRDNLDNRCSLAHGACPLQIALMEDHGTASGGTISGFEADLAYAYPTYMTHPSYWTMTVGSCSNRPVVLSFGWASTLDNTGWGTLKDWIHSSAGLNKTCTGEPLLIAEGENGIFNFTNLDGAFNWIGVDPYWSGSNPLPCNSCDVAGSSGNPGSVTSLGLSGTGEFNLHLLSGSGSFSVDHWYKTAVAHPARLVLIGSAYAGFNDTNADWGFQCSSTQDCHKNGRKQARECGLVWLNAWNRVTAAGYSGINQVPFVGIPTWNDYEEGSAIESGIDNCFDDASFRLSLNGSILSWQINFTDATFGSAQTIHHFTLFDGADPQGNSMTVHADDISLASANCQPVSVNNQPTNSISCSIDVSTYGTWPAGTHYLFIKAVGQPAIRNHMSSQPGPGYNNATSSLTPASLDFGSLAVGQTGSPQAFVFQNTSASPLQVTSVLLAGDFTSADGSATACQTVIAAGATCTINVSFAPRQAGARTGTLTVNSTSNNSPNRATLSGIGDNTTSTLKPATHDFGFVTVGNTSTLRTFILKNTGSTPMVVSSIAFAGDYSSPDGSATVCQTSIPAGGTCAFNVMFIPAQAGFRPGTVTVNSTSNSSPNTSTLSGTGTTVPRPFITGISPSSSATGATVTITGNNFGDTPSNSTVTFNGALATINPSSWSSTSISINVPAMATTGNVAVTVGGQHSNGSFFTVPVGPDDALHISGSNCATCGWQVSDFTFQASPLYGYVIQPGDVLYFHQYQSSGSVAGITLCFANAETCDDDGNTVDQDGQPIHADRLHNTNHFRRVNLTPSAGLTLSQITLDSSGFTQPGRWDVFFRDIEIISADGTVRPIFMTGSTPTLSLFTSGGATQQGYAIDHSAVPAIASLSSTTGSLGAVITITGSNFGNIQSFATVFFNGAIASPSSWSDTSISLPVPIGATSGNVVVMVGGQSSNGVPITIQEDALHISGVNCATCGWQITDFTFQNSPMYGYVIQPGDALYFLQNQSIGSVAGITLCFAEGDGLCDDDGRTVDQDGQNINADTLQGGNHFRQVDLTPSAGLTINQVALHSSGFTQPGGWDVLFSDIAIVSADGTVRPIFVTGMTPSLFIFSSGGAKQQSFTIDPAHVW